MIKVLKVVGIVLLGLALIVGAYIAYWFHQNRPPDDPVSEYLMAEGWHEQTSLIPNIYQVGDTRTDIENQLEGYGYQPVTQSAVGFFWRGDIELGSTLYLLDQPSVVCRHYISVVLQFSETDQLTSAEGGDFGACM